MSMCDSSVISDFSLLPEYNVDRNLENYKTWKNCEVDDVRTTGECESNKKASIKELKAVLEIKKNSIRVEELCEAEKGGSNLSSESTSDVQILDAFNNSLWIEETPEKCPKNPEKAGTQKRRVTSDESDSDDRSGSPEIPITGPPVIFQRSSKERIILKISMSRMNRRQKLCTKSDIGNLLNRDDSSDESDNDTIFDSPTKSQKKSVKNPKNTEKNPAEIRNTKVQDISPREKKNQNDGLKLKFRRSTENSFYKIEPHERRASLRPKINQPSRYISDDDDDEDEEPKYPRTPKRSSRRIQELNNEVSGSSSSMLPTTRSCLRQKDTLAVTETPRKSERSSRKTKGNKLTETDDSPDTKISPKYTRSRSQSESMGSNILQSVQTTPSGRVERSCRRAVKINTDNEFEQAENDTNKANKSEDSDEDENIINRKRKLNAQDKIKTPKKLVTIVEEPDATLSTRNRTPRKVNKRIDEDPTTPKTSQKMMRSKTFPGRNGNLTPSMKQRTENVGKPKTILADARAQLHVSAVPSSLPCREEEFNNIFTFLHRKLVDHSSGCIYISGVPGTGKTATVNEAIRCLKKLESKNELEPFDRLEINGMKLTEPRQAYSQILKQLTGQTMSWEQSHKFLEKKFTKSKGRRPMTLLLVDELDLLCNRRQDVVYNLLDWPAKEGAQLVVITIANTMDLPERVLMGRVTSRLGLTRLTFQPYNHKQLQEIVETRLRDSEAFRNEAIELVARKVSAVSGDARRALDICRRATEIAESRESEMVLMQDVNDALQEMIASPKVQAIKHCSEMEKLFLKAVCAEIDRTGVEEVTFFNVSKQFSTLCIFDGLQIPNVTQTLGICSRLSANRLLLCEHSRADIFQRILLNVSADDIHFALKLTEF